MAFRLPNYANWPEETRHDAIPQAIVLDLSRRNRHEFCGSQAVRTDHIADLGSTHLRIDLQFLGRQSPNLEVVMVRLVASRWASSALSGHGKIGTALHGAGRQFAAIALSCISIQMVHGGGNVQHAPMPPSASGRRIRIIHGHSETFRTFRRT
jgi:hypothetical protein